MSNSDLEPIAEFLTSSIGPDYEAILDFTEKEQDKIKGTEARLNELKILINEVPRDNQNTKDLCSHLSEVFSSIDSTHEFISDVKKRLILLDKQVSEPLGSKIASFFKKNVSNKTKMHINGEGILYNTNELMEKYGLDPNSGNDESKD